MSSQKHSVRSASISNERQIAGCHPGRRNLFIDNLRIFALTAATVAGLLTAACIGPDSTSGSAGEPKSSGGLVERDGWIDAAIANLSDGYTGVKGVWTGFDPGDHPSVVVHKTGKGRIESALAINFPSPNKLGASAALNTYGTPFTSLHRITEFGAGIETKLRDIENFEFSIDLAGVDSFVMVAQAGDEILDPSKPDWVATFMHEMFHRHQQMRFAAPKGDQDVENYAFDVDNIAMATLEERALRKAIVTDDAAARRSALRHFAALRIARLLADERVVLDNDQERFEGSARYIEHRLAGSDTRFGYHDANYGADLIGDPDALLRYGAPISSHYAFDRFYATGAAVLRALDLLGATGVDLAVRDGKSPADVLIARLGVTRADVPGLIADARTAYDPENKLHTAAKRAAAAAAKEGPVFGEDEDGYRGGDSKTDEEAIELTEAEERCLVEQGVSEDVSIIPEAVYEKCVSRSGQ